MSDSLVLKGGAWDVFVDGGHRVIRRLPQIIDAAGHEIGPNDIFGSDNAAVEFVEEMAVLVNEECQEVLAQAKTCIRASGFAARNWRDRGGGVWDTTIWVEGKIGGWQPRLWAVVPEGGSGKPAIIPGYTKDGVWLWGRSEILRAGQIGSLRKELSAKLKAMRSHLAVWAQAPVPTGAGEKIGRAVDRKFTPWYSHEVPHHGSIWQSREPMEYRGVSLLEAFGEIVAEEWQRRKLRGFSMLASARVIESFYRWYKSEWQLPDFLVLTAKEESQTLWLYEKKPLPAPKLRKRSLISNEVAAALRQERKELKLARRTNNGNNILDAVRG